MADVLSYADPHAWSRVRHEVWARGGRVVVPGLGSPAVGWTLAGAGGLLTAGGLGLWALVGDNCLSIAAVAAGVILMMAGGFRVNFPGGEPAAAFTYADAADGRRTLEAEVYLAGDPVPQRFRWERSQVDDVRVGFARGFDHGRPVLELVVVTADREAVGLMPPQRDARTLQAVGAVLRHVLGLPSPRAGRAAWLAAEASRRSDWQPGEASSAGAADGVAAGATPLPAVPVLGYHAPRGTAIGPMLERADVTPDALTLTLAEPDGFDRGSVRVELTPDRLTIRWPEWEAHVWPCDALCGAYVGFTSERAPAELCVYAVDGTTRLLAGAPAAPLRELAALLNAALGVPGTVY